MSDSNGDGTPPPLPPRAARPWVTHVAVDAVIGFLATAIVLYFLGAPLWAMIAVAWVLGLAAAPLTQRWEAEQLAARDSGAASDPNA